jgi:glutamyl-tRNA reductase
MLQVGVVGVNYKTAPLELREALSKEIIAFPKSLQEKLSQPFVLLVTCNRFEVYFSSQDLYAASHEIVRKLEKIVGFSSRSCFYHYFDHTCFYHLSKVICGLDAAILGESDIQGQVKRAYYEGALDRQLPKDLHYLFQKSLRIGKQIRTHFFPSHKLMTLEEVIYLLSKEWLDKKILFIGYSEINRKIMQFFRAKGVSNMAICTGANLTSRLRLEKIEHWVNYPIVIVGTKRQDYVLKLKEGFDTKLVFDLGMPRSVDPLLKEALRLYTLEDLSLEIEKRQIFPSVDLRLCEKAIADLTSRYEKIYAKRELNKTRMLLSV